MTRQEYKADWLRRKRAIVKAHKLATGCENGCRVMNPNALHFHHRNPATKDKRLNHDNTIAFLYHRDKLESDCVLLCQSCHSKTESYGKGR